MTELDNVGNCDNFNFRWVSIFSFGSSKNIQREKVGHIVQFRVVNLHQLPFTKLAAKARHDRWKYARCARRQREKRWNVCTVMVLLYTYSKIFGVSLLVCSSIKTKVLLFIKV